LKHYNISPIVGIAIAAFGSQLITTVLVTYAADCHSEHAASVELFVNLIRSTLGFIGESTFFPSPAWVDQERFSLQEREY
jgi:hypothetical protein